MVAGDVKPGQRRARWLLITAAAGVTLSLSVFAVAFNFYAIAVGVDAVALGNINAAVAVGAALAVLPAGLLADSWGRKRTLVVGGMLFVAGAAAQSLAVHPVILGLGGFLAGTGGAAAEVVSLPVLVEITSPDEQPFVLSLAGALQAGGSAAGSVLGGVLPGWWAEMLNVSSRGAVALRFTLLFALAMAALPSLAFLLAFSERRSATHIAEASRYDPRGWWSLLWRGGAVTGTVGLGAGLLIPYLNLYFVGQLQATLAQFGLLAGVTSVLVALATAVAGWVIPRLGMVRTMVLTQGIATFLLAGLALAPCFTLAAPLFALRNMAMDMAQPAAVGWLIRRVPGHMRAVSYGLLLIAFQVPWAIGSALSGLVRTAGGFSLAFVLTGSCYLASTLLWAALFRSDATAPSLGEATP
ncbi:MAG: MFS transporter [Chloroflexi bacterium]|nr:MFS transporter [Chloroflexota bacterium]